MSSKIVPGKYLAQVVDYSIKSTQKGDPEPIIRFKFIDKDGDAHQYNWRGTLKEGKGREITLASLVTCGFSGDDLSVLCDGVESGALNTEQQVNISVELEKGSDGKEYAKIAWINPLKASGFKGEMTRDEAKAKLASMNIGADLAAAKASTPRGSTKPAEPVAVNPEAIPF